MIKKVKKNVEVINNQVRQSSFKVSDRKTEFNTSDMQMLQSREASLNG